MFTSLQNKTVAILGLGLIGGSIARGLKKNVSPVRILAWDSDEATIGQGRDCGVVDGTGSLEDVCEDADIIVLALPSLDIAELLPRTLSAMKAGAVATDVGSVKSRIYSAVREKAADRLNRFVPGHPIAGSEKSGFVASNPGLFNDRNVILTPSPHNDCDAVALVNELWRSLGANVLGMDLEWHDEVLAATSHLPHLLAFAIVDVLAGQDDSEDIFRYAAGGFADFSRLASSDPRMWADIFTANAEATTAVLDRYIADLGRLRRLITATDHQALLDVFSSARLARNHFMDKYFNPSGSGRIQKTGQLKFTVSGESELGTELREIRVPGDKSISHRAVILGALADGVTRISGFLEGEDTLNTVAAFREMGVTITGPKNGHVTVYGVGLRGLKAPRRPLYLGNSGTAMRLLSGILAAQEFDSELTGDDSLSGRPMGRIAEPLRQMGAQIETSPAGTPPLRIRGTDLRGIRYRLPVASAQVKSCLLLAGLYGSAVTELVEPAVCRDHTERMLAGFGIRLEREEGSCRLAGGQSLKACDIEVPGDLSSAAFFLVAAAISPGAQLRIRHVGVNPTRTGIINLLRAMGAHIEFENEREAGGEPVADILVRQQALSGIEIPAEQIPLAIDEFPVLFIAAACASGETVLRGAEELRVKESDRIDVMATGLGTLGIETEVFPDGIRIRGGKMSGGDIDSRGDHRIAMAFAIAGLRASGPIHISNCANVATSFPGFVDLARGVGLGITGSR